MIDQVLPNNKAGLLIVITTINPQLKSYTPSLI